MFKWRSQVLNIFVSPSSDGVSRYAYIYDPWNNFKSSVSLCSTTTCTANASTTFAIPLGYFAGIYSFNVYDNSINTYAVKNFTVLSATNTCTDSDGGLNFYAQGTVSGLRNNTQFSYTDYCLNSTNLIEYTCINSTYKFNCNNPTNRTNSTSTTQCINGACV